MKPSSAIELHRETIRDLVAHHKAKNPRVFGSSALGLDHEGSDLDILVEALPGATLFDLGGLQDALEQLLKTKVDVVTEKDLPMAFRSEAITTAKAL